MWNYEKRLQYPINITQPNAQIAQVIMSQYGGPYCQGLIIFLLNAKTVCCFSHTFSRKQQIF